jgi:heterodisulfide reductase subunit A
VGAQQEREKAIRKAEDLVRMAVANARLLEPLEKIEVNILEKAMVLGGGVSWV